jgi:hypothetical protein
MVSNYSQKSGSGQVVKRYCKRGTLLQNASERHVLSLLRKAIENTGKCSPYRESAYGTGGGSCGQRSEQYRQQYTLTIARIDSITDSMGSIAHRTLINAEYVPCGTYKPVFI